MSGIRIRPQPARHVPDNAVVVVVDKTRPIPLPKDGRPLSDLIDDCKTCGYLHEHKTYHLQLRAGSIIVSDTIWGRLQGLIDNGGFEFMNIVEDPPAQGLSINTDGTADVVLLEKYVMPIGG